MRGRSLAAHPVIVSITSLPSRIGRIRPCLESLLAGSLVPDKILLPLPARSIRENAPYILPDFLQANELGPVVELVRVERDWGPGTKLLGVLPVLPQPCYLALADDDVVYKPSFLKGLIGAQAADHAASFSYHVYRWRGLQIAQGCDGFSFWSPNISEIEPFVRKCVDGTNLLFHDDLWISFYLTARGIAVKSIAYESGPLAYEKLHEINSLRALEGALSRRRLSREGLKHMIDRIDMPWEWKARMRMRVLSDRLFAGPARKIRRKIALLASR